MFSPPAWGWSVNWHYIIATSVVFPTRVGMVRVAFVAMALMRSFPHPRGDGPPQGQPRLKFPLFSPPAWGWSGSRKPA